MDFKKITGTNDYPLDAVSHITAKDELRELTLFQITNIVAKINPITSTGVSLDSIIEYAEKNKDKLSCKYNSIKKSGLNLKCPGRNVSYLLFKSGKVSFIGLKIKDHWSNLKELDSKKSEELLEEINDRIVYKTQNFSSNF